MTLVIRPFRPADYPAIAEIRNATWTDDPVLAETLQSNDSRIKPGLILRRLVAERHGQVLGNAVFYHMEWMHHPQKFGVGISVHPEHQGQGIGTALYDAVMAELQTYNPIKLLTSTRADKPEALRFAEKRGFHETFRAWESRLELSRFEPAHWAKDVQRVLDLGYQIKSLAELMDDPDYQRKMYELDHAGSYDIPLPPGEVFTFPTQERYWETVRSNPDFDPQLWFLVVKDSEYLGVSMLFKRPADNDLNAGFTTVRREHRHQGVALALKIAALSHAKQLGKTAVRTVNAQVNRSMLAINEALGFEKMPAWIDLAKIIKAGG